MKEKSGGLVSHAANEWLPIESAPKDRTRIMVCEKSGAVNIVWWIGAPHDHWSIDGFRHVTKPTHWMPLPNPP